VLLHWLNLTDDIHTLSAAEPVHLRRGQLYNRRAFGAGPPQIRQVGLLAQKLGPGDLSYGLDDLPPLFWPHIPVPRTQMRRHLIAESSKLATRTDEKRIFV
jgi:hypothetical protein